MSSQNYKKTDIVVCPICGNDEPYAMGFGETDLTAYYSCTVCGHDFMVDMNKVLKDESETPKETSEKSRLY